MSKINDPQTGLSYIGKQVKKDEPIYIDRCWRLSPNNDEVQEIYVDAKTFDDKEITLVFTPDDWLDTFTPTMYEHIKKNYIKYLKQKK